MDALVSAVGVLPIGILLFFLGLLLFYLLSEVCEEALVPALEGLSEDIGVPHDVASATFVALGSSAAEIAVNSVAAYDGKTREISLATGALVGSALIAFTLIPAICTVVSPGRVMRLLLVPLVRDVGFFCIAMALVLKFSEDENFDLRESTILCGVFCLYVCALFALIGLYDEPLVEESATGIQRSTESQYGTVTASTSQSMMLTSNSREANNGHKPAGVFRAMKRALKMLIPPFRASESQVVRLYIRYMVVSLLYIGVLSEACLRLAVAFGNLMQISHQFIGLVLVALATQIDDFATTMATARKGKGPSSLANAIGSQVINITLGFGLPFLVSNLVKGLPVVVLRQTNATLWVFFAVMMFVLCVIIGRLTLNRRDVFILLATYGFVVWRLWTVTHPVNVNNRYVDDENDDYFA